MNHKHAEKRGSVFIFPVPDLKYLLGLNPILMVTLVVYGMNRIEGNCVRTSPRSNKSVSIKLQSMASFPQLFRQKTASYTCIWMLWYKISKVNFWEQFPISSDAVNENTQSSIAHRIKYPSSPEQWEYYYSIQFTQYMYANIYSIVER